MNSPVFLNKTTLNLTWPVNQEIMLHQGEVLQGQVRGFTPEGLVLLYLKGQLIEAAAEILVEPGQTLHLSVESVKQGQAHLRVLTPSVLAKTGEQAFAARLMDSGIPPGVDTVQIARTLADYRLPVTRTNVETVLQGCTQLGEINPQNINQVAFQIARDIPVIKPILEALSQYIGSTGSLDQLVSDVAAAVKENLAYQAAGNPVSVPANNENPVVQTLRQTLIPDAETPAGKTSGPQPQLLPDRPAAMSGELETRPAAADQPVRPPQVLIPATASEPSAANNAAGLPAPVDKDVFVRLLNWLPGLLESLQLDPDQEPSLIAAKMRAVSHSPQDIIRSLTLIQDILQSETIVKNHPSSLSLAGKIEDLVREFTGQQVMQANPQRLEVSMPAVYLAFPVQIDQDVQLCRLRVHGDTSRKSLEQREQVNMVVSLDTAKLGNVLFHVAWHAKGILDLQGVVENSKVKEYLGPLLVDLNTALEGQGYQVNNLGLKVVPPEESPPLAKVLPRPDVKDHRGLVTVDIIV